MVAENNNEKKISALLEDLSLLESYSQELFSFTPLPIFFTSPTGVILEANPEFEKITGMDAYEIIGEGIERVFNKEEINKILKKTLKSSSVRNEEIKIINKEEKEIPVSIFSRVRKTKKGKSMGCFFGLFDLTEIKKKEAALKESSQVSEIKVAAKTRELRELAEDLEIKVKERTKKLEEKLGELERINKLMIGRELKMVELKEELRKAQKN